MSKEKHSIIDNEDLLILDRKSHKQFFKGQLNSSIIYFFVWRESIWRNAALDYKCIDKIKKDFELFFWKIKKQLNHLFIGMLFLGFLFSYIVFLSILKG